MKITRLAKNILISLAIAASCAGGASTAAASPPQVVSFAMPQTSRALAVPVFRFTATDDVAVTGFMITESASAPAAGDAGWTIAPPAHYAFFTEGSKTLYAWVKDGDGAVSTSATATIAVGASQPLIKVGAGAGSEFSAAVRSDGTVLAWGRSDTWANVGQMQVPSGLNTATHIATGYSHVAVLKSDGTVTAWGSNGYGGTTIPAGLSGVAAIAAGYEYTAALLSNGTVTVWGYGIDGATTIPAGLTNVVAIAAGMYHVVALKSDGTVTAWGGNNAYGQRTIPGGMLPVVAIAAGYDHTVAVQSDGTVIAWGRNDFAQIDVPGGLANVVSVAAGVRQSVAVLADGSISGWGLATQYGALPVMSDAVVATTAEIHSLVLKADGTIKGFGHSGYSMMFMPPDFTNTVALAAGSNTSVALKSDGTVTAWGTNNLAQQSVPAGMNNIKAVSGKYNTMMGLKTDGTVTLWGELYYGQVPIPGSITNITAVAVGAGFDVALKADGTVAAWGYNNQGQSTVPSGLTDVVAIAAGWNHTLALKSNGTVTAWGWNTNGQTTVRAGLSGVVAIEAGATHSLALRSNGTVTAWGNNANGQTTIPAGLSGVVAIAAGANHSVALKSDGTVTVWGDNSLAQKIIPAGLSGVVAIAAGENHTIALKSDGHIASFGGHMEYGESLPPTGTDTTPPAIYQFAVASRSTSSIVPIIRFMVQDNVGTAGYMVTESSLAPASGDSGWSTTPPATYTATATGSVGLYAWAKDAAGNVSSSLTSTSFIDTTPPTTPGTPTDSGILSTSATVTFTWTAASDSESGVASYNLQVGTTAGGSNIYNGNAGNVLAKSATGSNGQTLYARVQAVNGMGVAGSWSGNSDGITIDTQAPSISAASIISNNTNTQLALIGNLVTVSFTASENIYNPVVTIAGQAATVSGSGTTWSASHTMGAGDPEGSIAILISGFTDSAGNAGISRSATTDSSYVLFDRAAPIVKSFIVSSSSRTLTVPVIRFTASDANILAGFLITETASAPASGDPGWTMAPPASYTFGSEGDKTLYAWAKDWLGNVSSSVSATVSVGSALPLIKASIIAGPYQTAALKSDGSLAAWGQNNYGQLNIPVGLSDVVRVAIGAKHTAINKADGTVQAWGDNSKGQISVPGGLSGVAQVTAGNGFSAALKLDGTVVAWGDGAWGMTTVTPGLSDAIGISAGDLFTLALRADGTVTAWGDNSYGQKNIPSGLSQVIQIAAGYGFSVALRSDGTVTAWGQNNAGQTTIRAGLSGIVEVASGRFHTVALKSDGTVTAWGDNSAGQTSVPGGLTGVVKIAAGDYHTVAYKADGTIAAWGGMNSNAYGDASVPGDMATAVGMASGTNHSVIVRADGTVAAWGKNTYGQTTIPAGLSGVMKVAAGDRHSVALLSNGTVTAWGDNTYGQLAIPSGLNNVVEISARTNVGAALKSDGTVTVWGEGGWGQKAIPAGLSGVVSLIAGDWHMLALKSDGTVVAWGYSSTGMTTIPAGLSDVVGIAANERNSYALKSDGTVVAWGNDNTYGQKNIPVGLSNAVAIAAGLYHALALKSDGTVVAWGQNTSGQASIPSGLSGVAGISGGSYQSAAIKADGTFLSWGTMNYRESAAHSEAAAPTVFRFVPAFQSWNSAVPISSFMASDDTEVTGFMVSESATPPLTADAGWTVAPPASYTVSGNGTRTLYAWTKDAAGNVSSGMVGTALVDTDGPTTPGTPTDRGAYASSSVTFDWTAATDGDSGILRYNLQVGSSPGASNVFNGSVGNVLTYTVTGSAGQTLYARVQAVNTVGRAGSWSGNSDGVYIDTTLPGTPGTPVDAGVYTASTSVTFTWTGATDADSGIVSYNLQVGTSAGASDIYNSNVGNVLSATVTGSHNQTLYARVAAVNGAGLTGSWSGNSDGIKIDTSAPGAPGTPTDRGLYSGATTTFSWTAATDAESGIASYYLQVGTSAGASDLYSANVGSVLTYAVTGSAGQTLYARVAAVNGAGTTGSWSGDSDGITIDVTGAGAPGTPADAGMYSPSTSTTFTWTAASDAESGVVSYNLLVTAGATTVFNSNVGNVLSYAVTGSQAQTLVAKVQAVNGAGLLGTWSALSDGIKIDTSIPGTPGTPTDAGTYTSSTSVTFNWTAATDAESGIASYNLQVGTSLGASDLYSGNVGTALSSTVTGSQNQTLYARVQAVNGSGLTGSWSGNSNGILIDTTAPGTPGTPLDRGIYSTASTSFSWTAASDAESGIASYNLQVGTTPGASDVYNANVGNVLYRVVTGTNGQTLYARVQAVNGAGLTGSWSGDSDGVIVDTVTPGTPGTPADAGMYSPSTSVSFTWTASTVGASGMASYNLQIGTSAGASDQYNGNVGNVLTYTHTGTQAQTLYARVQALNTAGATGSWSSASDGIKIDTTAPSTPGTPADAGIYTTSTSVTITWAPSTDAESGVAGYNVQIGSSAGASDLYTGSVGTTPSYTYSGSSGQNVFARVQAINGSGLTSSWSGNSNGILIDTTGPAKPNAPTHVGAYSGTTSVAFNWTTTTDAESGIASYNFEAGSSAGANDLYSGNVGTALTKTVTTGSNGQTVYARVQAVNNAGITSAWSDNSSGVLIDTTAPGAPGAPADAGLYSGSTVSFSWTAATDSESGISGYNLQVGTTPGASNIYSGAVGTVLTYSVTGSQGQTLYARVQAVNGGGLTGAWSGNSDGITIDTTAPSTPGTPSAGATATSSTTVAFTWTGATDGESGVAGYNLMVGTSAGASNIYNSSVGTALTYTVTGSNGQTLYAKVQAVNGAGIAGSWSGNSTGILIDTQAPSTSASPAAGNYNTAKSITLSCSDAGGSGCATIYYTTNGDIPTTSSSVYGSTIPVSANTTIKYFSVDAVGNQESYKTADYVIDTTKPTGAITFPADRGTYNEVYYIEGTAGDAGVISTGVATVEIQIYSGSSYYSSSRTWRGTPQWVVADGTTAWYLDTSSIVWTNGKWYYLTVRTTDNAGNVSTTSTQFYYYNGLPVATELSLTPSAQSVQLNGTVSLMGKLTRLPDIGTDLSGLVLAFKVTDPDGIVTSPSPTILTNDAYGHYVYPNLGGFTKSGMYKIQASFGGNAFLDYAASAEKNVLVGDVAGYAIIVEGKIPASGSPAKSEGLETHNKTVNRIYEAFKSRGFTDDNIYLFKYPPQAPAPVDPSDIIIDATPTKTAIQSAITGTGAFNLMNQMNSAPAPVFIVMVDHGAPGNFYVDSETINPTELNAWLTTLESGLNADALANRRIVIDGSCYSGSFIPALAQGATSTNGGRIVITSAASNEESYRGPQESDGIRSGEFFLDELFKELTKGSSLKSAFRSATEKTEIFTFKGGASANSLVYNDTAVQHPLLDDTGAGVGSNSLSDGSGDGVVADSLYLGFGSTNAVGSPAEYTAVSSDIYLDSATSTATLWGTVGSNAEVDSAWIEVRPHSLVLSGPSGTAITGQLSLDIPKSAMTYSTGAHRWEAAYDQFLGSGTYDIYYFTARKTTLEVSEMKRSRVYKAQDGNSAPNPFNLTSPADNSETKTILVLDWEDTTDPDGDPVTYTVQFSLTSDFTGTLAYQQEDITDSALIVDSNANLQDLSTYWWKVIAVDRYGAKTESSQTYHFRTNNTNELPGILSGTVIDAVTGLAIPGATITAGAAASVTSAANGAYFASVPAGSIMLTASASGYTSSSAMAVVITSGGALTRNISLMPVMYTLSVGVTGTGSVTSSPSGISCGATCSKQYGQGIVVTLTATPGGSSTFAGWGGACAGTGSCIVTMDAARSVTAAFNALPPNTYSVTPVAGTGGSISPATPRSVSSGATTSFTITPSTGYQIGTVVGCGGSLVGSTYTTGAILSACTVTAAFTVNVTPRTVTPTLSGSGGTINPSIPQVVTGGSTTAFTLTPNSGYAISSVSGCGGALVGYTYTTAAIFSDCTVTASFVAIPSNTHTITPYAGSNGSISPSSPQTVNDGSGILFTVSPSTGYHVADVKVDGASVGAVTMYPFLSVVSDHTITATFAINTYTVTPSAGSNGSISLNTAQTVSYSQTTSFTITPNSGYAIDLVTGCSGSLSGSVYTTGPVTADCTVSASFALRSYTVSAAVNGGNGSVSPASQSVNYGSVAAITATPNTGYSVSTMSGCGGSLAGNTYITAAITSNCTVTALFSINTFSVIPSAGANGSITPATTQIYSYGTTTTFMITPGGGYHINSVSGCGGSLVGNAYTVGPITSSCTIAATFAADVANTYSVIPSAGAGGSISPNTTQLLSAGSTTAFTITPSTGYQVSLVSGCSGSLAGNLYTIAPAASDCVVNAQFSIITNTVTPAAVGNGSISPSTPQTVNYNATTSFTVTPDTGYHVTGVVGCNGSLNGTSYTTGAITSSCTVTASYAIDTYLVSASSNSGGSISPASELVSYGSATSFTVTTNPGYSVSMGGTCGGTLVGPTYTTTGITGPCTVIATFTRNSYTVSASAGSGGSISPSSTVVSHGSTTTFSVTPETGYTASASGCGGTLAGTTFTTGPITGPCSIDAVFSLITYTITPSAGSGGSISPSTPQGVSYGSGALFSISPATGYHVVDVKVDGISVGAVSMYPFLSVAGNHTISATFAINTYTVTPSAGPNGSISPGTAQTVSYNGTTSFTITPDTGYAIGLVTGCSGSLSGSTYTTGGITADCTVIALFVSTSGGGGGVVGGAPGSGDLDGNGITDIYDAMRMLRIAMGIQPATAADLTRGDVAPVGAPDGVLDIGDVIVILRKAVGL